MLVLETLAEFVAGLAIPTLGAGTMHAARMRILDTVAAAVAGAPEAAPTAVREAAFARFAPGSVSVWLHERRLTSTGAAMANAAAASALDVDDGHRAAVGHPGAVVVPTAIATAEEVGASGGELLAAIIAGYEVGVRIAGARDLAVQRNVATGWWAPYAAAAAAGRLRRLDVPRLAQALAIAGFHAPAVRPWGRESHMTKEAIPWGVLAGTMAVDLAERGFTGPIDGIDRSDEYDVAGIVAALGPDPRIETAYTKPYACCRWAHGPIDAVLSLASAHRFGPRDVERIEVHTFARALRLPNLADPRTLEGAQYSIPFCVAVALVGGGDALLPLDAALLGRADIVELARRVDLRVDPGLDERFPRAVPARVVVTTARGVFDAAVDVPLGDPANPLSTAELEAKFRRLTARAWDRSAQDAVLAAVAALGPADDARGAAVGALSEQLGAASRVLAP